MRYLTRHPHTGEICEMSNREWRCVKVGIPATSDLWTLLSAEKEYIRLLTIVTERLFDAPTSQWLYGLIDQWPVDICSSPQALLCWYTHLMGVINIDEYVAQLAKAAELQQQLDKIMAKRQKDAVRLVRSMQRDLNKLRKLKAAEERAKRNRKKNLRRRR